MTQLDFFEQPLPSGPSDLHWFDWTLVNSSGGKDSQTTIRQVVIRADAEAYPRSRIVVAHADLGRVEWPGTKELARQQAEHYGLRFEIVRRTQDRDLLEHVENRGKWPGLRTTRYCTSDHKRGPIRTLMTRLADEWHGGPHSGKGRRYAGRACRILNAMGMRAQESDEREKLLPYELNHENSRRIVYDWLPIHKWKLPEVWADIKASGVPYHPAYDLGMPRLSCCFCIYAPPEALILAGKHNPELLDDYVRVEQKINHKFRVDVSLADIQRAVRAGTEAGTVADWSM